MLIKYTNKDLDLLARTMRSEALSEGELGMMMVGNVIINRCIADCYTFKNLRTIPDVIYQKNQFSGTKNSLFNSKSTTKEKNLAKRVLEGEKFYPASYALWFYAPKENQSCNNKWYNQELSGKYKNHCFYKPNYNECKNIY